VEWSARAACRRRSWLGALLPSSPGSVTPGTVRQRIREGNLLGALGMLAQKSGGNTDTILWVIAAVLVIAGIVALVRGSVLVGIVLIVLGLLVGPGGVSIFD
jgi:hypothetical protein